MLSCNATILRYSPLVAGSLDDIDFGILGAVQADGRATLEQVGAAVGLSAAAVQRRLVRLRADGVLIGSHALVDPRSVGIPILVLVFLTLESDGGGAESTLDEKLANHPNVQQAYELAGSFDRAVVIAAPDMETYRALARAFFDADPNVKRFASHVVLGTLKRSLDLPIDSALSAE